MYFYTFKTYNSQLSMNNFSEYEKIPQSFKSLNLDEKAFQELEKVKWVVTEKVHGANFSFIYELDNDNNNNHYKLFFAKRKEILFWNDDFFAFQLLVNQIEDKILNLFEALNQEISKEINKEYSNNTTIFVKKYIIFGELFGGEYPHANIPQNTDLQAIQTGVYYSNNIGFYAFDIAFETEDKEEKKKENNQSERIYLDYDKALNYFEKYGLFHAKSLFIGKLNEALTFNTRINSTIPALLGLPLLESNLIEGVVVKPFHNPSTEIIKFRPIIKIKNKEFDEKTTFHQAKKWSYTPETTFLSKSVELSFLVDELCQYLNQNRLNSVLSKIGNLDKTNILRMENIKKELLRDILADFDEDTNNMFSELQPPQKLWLKDRLNAKINDFLD